MYRTGREVRRRDGRLVGWFDLGRRPVQLEVVTLLVDPGWNFSSRTDTDEKIETEIETVQLRAELYQQLSTRPFVGVRAALRRLVWVMTPEAEPVVRRLGAFRPVTEERDCQIAGVV